MPKKTSTPERTLVEKNVADPQGIANAREVAERVGVSVMTVSRALRGLSNVSPATREKIIAAAREIGYYPSLAARTLRTGRVQVVGFVSSGYDSLRGEYNSDMLAGLDSIMVERDYLVLLILAKSLEDMIPRMEQVTQEGRVGGLVVLGSTLKQEQIDSLGRINFPMVVLNYSDERPIPAGISTVSYDNAGGMLQVVRHLAALGHTKIAYVGGDYFDHDAEDREEGFRRAMKELDLPIVENWIRAGSFARALESGSEACDYLLAEGSKGPTAIACASDKIAAGVLMSCRRAGVSVPDDLSVTGFDDEVHSSFQVPPLTTILHSGWEIGRMAGQILLDHLHPESEDEKPEATRRRIPVKLVVRNSTALSAQSKRR